MEKSTLKETSVHEKHMLHSESKAIITLVAYAIHKTRSQTDIQVQ